MTESPPAVIFFTNNLAWIHSFPGHVRQSLTRIKVQGDDGSEKMITTQQLSHRNSRIIDRIESVLGVRLGPYGNAIQVSIENTVIVLRGELPNADLKQQLVPAVRQAGVLCQVSDCVQVSS